MVVLTYALLFVSLYFEVFLLVSFLERGLVRRVLRAPGTTQPRVAIVVPCFNEERGIAETLTSLLKLEYPKDKLEIIVVDDGSHDNTLALAREYAHDPRVRIFSKENGGKHTAMNYALALTSAELIGCLDADSVVDAQALTHIA